MPGIILIHFPQFEYHLKADEIRKEFTIIVTLGQPPVADGINDAILQLLWGQ